MGFDLITYALCKGGSGGGGAWKEIGSAVLDSSVTQAIFTEDADGNPISYDAYSEICAVLKVTTGSTYSGQPIVSLSHNKGTGLSGVVNLAHTNTVIKTGGDNYVFVNAKLFPNAVSSHTFFRNKDATYPWSSAVANGWGSLLTAEEMANINCVAVSRLGEHISTEIHIYGRAN